MKLTRCLINYYLVSAISVCELPALVDFFIEVGVGGLRVDHKQIVLDFAIAGDAVLHFEPPHFLEALRAVKKTLAGEHQNAPVFVATSETDQVRVLLIANLTDSAFEP